MRELSTRNKFDSRSSRQFWFRAGEKGHVPKTWNVEGWSTLTATGPAITAKNDKELWRNPAKFDIDIRTE